MEWIKIDNFATLMYYIICTLFSLIEKIRFGSKIENSVMATIFAAAKHLKDREISDYNKIFERIDDFPQKFGITTYA